MDNTEIDPTSTIDTEDVFTESQEDSCTLNDMISEKDNTKMTLLPKDKRISKNKLTKYEYVRIISERTQQLTKGAKPLIKINKESEELNYKEIAEQELKYNMIPYKIRRPLPNNRYEIWELEELQKDHLI